MNVRNNILADIVGAAMMVIAVIPYKIASELNSEETYQEFFQRYLKTIFEATQQQCQEVKLYHDDLCDPSVADDKVTPFEQFCARTSKDLCWEFNGPVRGYSMLAGFLFGVGMLILLRTCLCQENNHRHRLFARPLPVHDEENRQITQSPEDEPNPSLRLQ